MHLLVMPSCWEDAHCLYWGEGPPFLGATTVCGAHTHTHTHASASHLPPLRENAVVRLNYAAALYNVGETQLAAKQFSEYEALVKKNIGVEHFDPEVCVC